MTWGNIYSFLCPAPWLIFTFSLCRKFLGKLVDDSPYVFGLKEYAKRFNLLDSLKELKETELRWKQMEKQALLEDLAMVIDPPKLEFNTDAADYKYCYPR